jgi:hypothetical protein
MSFAAGPLFFLVGVPLLVLAVDPGQGEQRSWRMIATLVAVLAGLFLALATPVLASVGFALAGLLAWIVAWTLGPLPARTTRLRLPAGEVELTGGPFPARVSRRGHGFERLLEYMCEVPAETLRLRIASDPWLGRQRPDPTMTVFDVPGWNHLIASNDVRWALTLLTPVLRSIVERCDAIHKGSFLLELRPGVLTIRSFAEGDEEHRTSDWLNDCTALAEHLRDALRSGVPMRMGAAMTEPDPAGIEVVEISSRAAQCQICGCVIDEAPVRCASCGTAHHADCWEYNGICSVYACGGCLIANR